MSPADVSLVTDKKYGAHIQLKSEIVKICSDVCKTMNVKFKLEHQHQRMRFNSKLNMQDKLMMWNAECYLLMETFSKLVRTL